MTRFRKFVLLGVVLTLALTAVAPALADDDSHGSNKGRGRSDVRGARSEPTHDEGGLRARALHGEIRSISGTIWSVERDGRGGIVLVDVAGARVHWPHREDATLADFRVGDTVNLPLDKNGRARGEGIRVSSDAISRARAVHFVPGGAHPGHREDHARFNGSVTAVSATSLTVNNATLGTRTFTLNADAKVLLGVLTAAIGDIHVGDRVSVVTNGTSTVALRVRIELDRFGGTVTAVSSTGLMVNNAEHGSRTFILSNGTQVRIGNNLATLADIRVGDRVRVLTRPGDATALLVVIRR